MTVLSSLSEVSVLMLQLFRNSLIALLVCSNFSVAGCSPAPQPPVEWRRAERPALPEKREPPRSLSSARDAGAARLAEAQAVIDAGAPAADGGLAGPDAAVLAQVVAVAGTQPTDGGAQPAGGGQPMNEEAAKIAPEDDPEAEEYKVPDCQGSRTVAPIWVRHVPFWAALCVHGLPGKSLRVDVGTSLISHDDLDNGDSANRYQVYYALVPIRVPANGKGLVWAMCGGGGEWLKSGTRVVPTHRLPAAKARLIAEHVDMLRGIETDFIMFMNNLRTATTAANRTYYTRGVAQLKTALVDAAGLLRDAVIKENRMILSRRPVVGAGSVKPPRPQPPPPSAKPPRPQPPPSAGTSGIPKPIIR